jgi:hypothetical protein
LKQPVPSPPRIPRTPVPIETSQALQIVYHVTPHPLLPTTVLNAKGEEVAAPIVALALRTNVALTHLDENCHNLLHDTRAIKASEAAVKSVTDNEQTSACQCGGSKRPGASFCSKKCGESFAANHNAQMLHMQKRLDEQEDAIEEEQRVLRARFKAAEVRELVALGREKLHAELIRVADEIDALAAAEVDGKATIKKLEKQIEGRGAKLHTIGKDEDAELQTARSLWAVAGRNFYGRGQKGDADYKPSLWQKLRDGKDDLKTLHASWRWLRERERDARMTDRPWPKTYCRVCVSETVERMRYCNNNEACSKKSHAAERPDAQHCEWCHRAFTAPEMQGGRIRQVEVLGAPRQRGPISFALNAENDPEDRIPQLDIDLVDVCSRECWNALVVDEDTPPYFPAVVYLAPPPLTIAARARASLQKMTAAAAQPETTTVPPSVRVEQARVLRAAAVTELDRYKSFLTEHPQSTDKDAMAAGFNANNLRRLHRDHPDVFVSDGRKRGATWSLR